MDERDPRYPAHQDAAAAWPGSGPTLQQFQQAGAGFVLPGAPSGHPPMSAAQGFVGDPQPPYAAPAQAWGFPTPNGMQLVQHGALPVYQPLPAGHAQPQPLQASPQQPWLQPAAATLAAAPALEAPAAAGAAPQRMGRRVRWETIVPAVAIMCFVAAVGLLIADFDSITGRAKPATSARTTTPVGGAGASDPAATGDAPLDGAVPAGDAGATASAKQLLAESRAYLAKGNFEAAATTLDPLLAADAPLPAVTRLSTKVAAAATRNRSLLQQLTRQQSAKDWAGAVVTIGQLKALRPLSPQLAADLRQARAKLLLAKTTARTAPKASPSNASSQRAPATPGAARGSGAKPPSAVPSNTLPPRPDAPKPAGNAAGGGGTPNGMPPAPTSNPSGMGDMVM